MAAKICKSGKTPIIMVAYISGFTVCLDYLDDIIVTGKSFTEHLCNLRKVLVRLREAKNSD